MPRNNINPQRMSVAATFYEPVYQRLRSWNDGKSEHLLGFTAATNPETRKVLQAAGAVLVRSLQSDCFTEVWSLSSPTTDLTSDSLVELDRQISESLRCQKGRFSAACGTMRWEDHTDTAHRRRHVLSQLLVESRDPRPRTR